MVPMERTQAAVRTPLCWCFRGNTGRITRPDVMQITRKYGSSDHTRETRLALT
jgi:hypothetical protein